VTKTTYVNRLENGLSAVRRRWTASEKVRIGRGDLRAGNDCELGGSPARRCAKPVVHVTPIGGARQPDRGRQRRGGGAGVGGCRTRFASFIGCWARRPRRPRFSRRLWNTPPAQKNSIRDEDRGRSDRRVPLEPGGALTAASAEEADRSAAVTGRGARGTDQGGDRRIADPRPPARLSRSSVRRAACDWA
jgi:hypothetical protein